MCIGFTLILVLLGNTLAKISLPTGNDPKPDPASSLAAALNPQSMLAALLDPRNNPANPQNNPDSPTDPANDAPDAPINPQRGFHPLFDPMRDIPKYLYENNYDHQKALSFPHDKLKNLQVKLLSMPVTSFEDPMVDFYDKYIKGKFYDMENRENTSKGFHDVNVPIIIRRMADNNIYRWLLMH